MEPVTRPLRHFIGHTKNIYFLYPMRATDGANIIIIGVICIDKFLKIQKVSCVTNYW